MVQWQNICFPSKRRGFDYRYPHRNEVFVVIETAGADTSSAELVARRDRQKFVSNGKQIICDFDYPYPHKKDNFFVALREIYNLLAHAGFWDFCRPK